MCRSHFACSHNTVTRQLKDILGEKNPPNKQLCFYLLDMDDFACISKNHLCFVFPSGLTQRLVTQRQELTTGFSREPLIT